MDFNGFLKSYKTIAKEATLFSGVQIILLFVSMIRNMIIAKYLGVEATGIMGVLQNTIGVFIALFSVGLPVLLVRSFALDETFETQKQQYVIKKAIIILGVLGSVLFYLFVPAFSKELFNHDGYDWILKIVAIVILFKQISTVNTSILQGKQYLSVLAKVNIISAVVGLVIAIPLYYYFYLEGVIYGFVVIYLIEVIVSSFAVKNNKKPIAVKLSLNDYRGVVKQGVVLGYGNVLSLLAQLAVIFYISSQSGNIQAGFYNAGFSIINNYVALLFIAMSTGYLPRIVKLLNFKENLQTEITKQLNFSLLVIGGLAAICIVFAPLIINILFSNEFEAVVPFLRVAVFGMIFKTFSWCLGYLIIAKVDKKVLMFTGIIFNLLFALALIYGFHINGIMGVAYAFVGYNFIHLISITLIVKFRYDMNIEIKTILLLIGILLFNGLLFLL